MPTYERGTFAPAAEAATEELPIDFDYMLDTFGLGPEEAGATITFGSYTGTVADMLTDKECPMGNIIATAYAEEGTPAERFGRVEAKLEAVKMLYGDFNLPISQNTRDYHVGTLDRSELITTTAPSEEPPSFLAQ